MLLTVVIGFLAVYSAAAQQDDCETGRISFVLGLVNGISCGLNFQTANNTPSTEAGMQALDAICTAECAGAVAGYVAGPPCNDPLEAAGLLVWCCPADNGAISRCRYALPDLLDPTIQVNLGACAAFALNPTMCPDNCADALSALSDEIGCCYQKVFNMTEEEIVAQEAAGTITAEQAASVRLLSTDALWTTCNVPSPGDCTGDPFPGTVTVTTVTTEGAVRTAATFLTIALAAVLSSIF